MSAPLQVPIAASERTRYARVLSACVSPARVAVGLLEVEESYDVKLSLGHDQHAFNFLGVHAALDGCGHTQSRIRQGPRELYGAQGAPEAHGVMPNQLTAVTYHLIL